MDVNKFTKVALECTVYLCPRAIGLTSDELHEIGQRFGLLQGEIDDSLRTAGQRYFAQPRIVPSENETGMLGMFGLYQTPDFRKIACFDFVLKELQQVAREAGIARAALDRDVLVERAVKAGLKQLDVDAAIVCMRFGGTLSPVPSDERIGNQRQQSASDTLETVRLSPAGQLHPGYASQEKERDRFRDDPDRQLIYDAVKDVIARRGDGRPSHAEPLDAFADALDGLGYSPFRLWWTQTVNELKRLDPNLSPVSTCVLSAALVEGALTFVVKRARDIGSPTLGSKDFDGKPNTWKIDDLVKSAAAGGDDAILREPLRKRADELCRTRQRIHAGRMLADFTGGPPDLRPEEARDAKATADAVLRAVLDWLAKHPAQAAPS